MAAGGTTGQVLTKASNNSYDTEWTTPAGGGGTVTDVTASAPLSSTGGATPDISIGGGTAGQVLTSNGASAPTFEDLPAPPTVPDASDATPQGIGTAAPGISADYARGDHVHDGSLADLDDVSATAPTAGQVLAWGGSEWAPATPATVPAASSSTPAGIGTAAVGSSADYARADHVHAGTVTALTDRYEELPAQTFSEFAHASSVSASPTRDIQTAIDATPIGPACQVIVGPGSYGGSTVTIPAGRNNIAIIGPTAGDFGGTVVTLSSGRALTIGNNVVRARLVNLQVEGLTTISTTGAGVHRFEQCQLEGGLTIGAISATIYVVGCTLGSVTIDAGFTGMILIDRCAWNSGATYTNNTQNYLKVLISDSAGLASAPTLAMTTNAAFLNGRLQLTSGATTYYADGTALLKAPLTVINGLTPAADRIAYYTSASAGALTTLTSFARTLLDDADAATARTTLGLGTAATSAATSFQSADATLTALAGVTTAANKLPYFTGVDTAAVADITTAGREILSTASSGTNGQVLTSSGGGAPTWTTVSGGGSGLPTSQSWTIDWRPTSVGYASLAASGWTLVNLTSNGLFADTNGNIYEELVQTGVTSIGYFYPTALTVQNNQPWEMEWDVWASLLDGFVTLQANEGAGAGNYRWRMFYNTTTGTPAGSWQTQGPTGGVSLSAPYDVQTSSRIIMGMQSEPRASRAYYANGACVGLLNPNGCATGDNTHVPGKYLFGNSSTTSTAVTMRVYGARVLHGSRGSAPPYARNIWPPVQP
jgi:hypothetical protein